MFKNLGTILSVGPLESTKIRCFNPGLWPVKSRWVQTSRSHGESAFTLIEVVAALMLSAILMLAVTSVMSQAMKLRIGVDRAAETLRGDELLRDQLRRDWTLAETCLATADGFWLTGMLLRDDGGGRMLHRSAIVRYQIATGVGLNPVANETDSWLLRIQWPVENVTALQPTIGGRASVEPIFHGINAIKLVTDRLEPLPLSAANITDPSSILQMQRSDVPSFVQVVLDGVDDDPIWSHTIRRLDE